MGVLENIGNWMDNAGRRSRPEEPQPVSTRIAAAEAQRRIEIQQKKIRTYVPGHAEALLLQNIQEAQRVRMLTLNSFLHVWERNILYAAGIQHITYMAAQRTWEKQRKEDWMPLPVFNHIQAKVQRIVDFFTRNRPVMNVEPNSNQEIDKEAAKLGDKVLQAIWHANNMDLKLDEGATWLATCGNFFTRDFIDTTMGSSHKIPQYDMQMQPVVGADGHPIISMDTGEPVLTERWIERRDEQGQVVFDEQSQGDVRVEIIAPFAMTVPMGCRTLDDSPWILETQLYSSDYIRKLYPDKADFIPETGKRVSEDLYQHRMANLLVSAGRGVRTALDADIMRGYLIVHQYEQAPSQTHPNGLLIVETEGIPLVVDELPKRTRYSYNHAGYYRVPHRFWFRGVVDDLTGPQDQINKLEQFLQLNDAFNSNPRTLVPEEANIAKGAIKGKPGLVIRYKYPFEPKILPGQSLPHDMMQRRQLYIEDMDEISGVRHVLMGDAPTGVSAGVALNRLGEEAEGMFAPITKRWERFIEQLGTSILEQVQLYYTAPRLLSIQDDDGNIEVVRDFVGTQLRGNTKVKVEAGSYRPRSKAGQAQLRMDALQMGLMPEIMFEPGKRQDFLEKIGVGDYQATESLDYKRARLENERLMRSEWQAVHREPGDNDVVHMQAHTEFRKTENFLRLPNEVQMRYLFHEREHIQALIETGGRPIVTGGEDADMAGPQGPDQGGGQQDEGGEAPPEEEA